MTQEQLEILCLEWQQRLRLQDWRVAVKIVPQYEIPGNWGECSRNTRKKIATIRVAFPTATDACVDHDFPEDPEVVLVHELLHLTFADFDVTNDGEVDPLVSQAQEQAINMIAGALVEAKRGNGHAIQKQVSDARVFCEEGTRTSRFVELQGVGSGNSQPESTPRQSRQEEAPE